MSENPAKTAVDAPETNPAPTPREDAQLARRLAEIEAELAAAQAAREAAEALAQAAEGKAGERERELTERLARMQADFENFRRRSREDAAQSAARGKLDFVKTIIPVLDNLERALAHAEDEGLRLLARQLHAALSSEGLLVLDPSGEAFDAKVHEALASESREGVKSGTVLAVVEKGYALDGKVLRPARVVVAA